MVRETLLDYFRTVAELDGEYLVYDDGFRPRAYSYPGLARAARNFAAKLQAHGIGSGDRIILWSENRPAWVAAFWGCVLRGVAVAPIDEHHSAEFLERVLRITSAKVIAAGDEVKLPGLEGLPPVWRLSDLDWKTPDARFDEVEAKPDDIAEILFTSGATAEPKGVIITHRNILANIVPVEREVLKYRKYAGPFSPIRFLNLLPLSHMFGQAMAIFIPPMISGTVIFQRSQDPREIVRQIKSRKISVLVSVPKILDVLKEYLKGVVPETAENAPAGEKFWWRWWRYRRAHRMFGYKFWSFVVGGAALDPGLEEFWGNLGWAVIQGYGLTEAAPIVTLNHPFHSRRGTVGKPIAGVQIRIADDGEVLVRGGNVTSGYFNNPEATAEAFENGWFHTGDVGELDESGRLMIKGRKKEMIVLPDGRNVFPEDVERVLNGIAGVSESAVIGLKADGGERVHAAIVLQPTARAEQVIAQVNAILEEHQKVRSYTVWSEPELPRTEGTRKLRRREIRARLSGEAHQAGPARAAGGMETLLGKWTAGRTVSVGTSLDDLGLSSLDRVELLVALERELGAPVDENAFSNAKTIADLEALKSAPSGTARPAEVMDFPAWNRSKWALWSRIFHLNVWLLNLARIFAWVRVEGRENLRDIDGPVIFACNHQGYFDAPIVFIAMPWKWRHKLAPAMRKEFFDAHYHPERHSLFSRLTSNLNYYLSCLMFNALPIPQKEAGTRQTLRYIGEMVEEGWCPLIFPEGKHSYDDSVGPFQAGAAMMASRLKVPVVPVRIHGSNRVLHPTWRFPRPGFVRVIIGAPVRLEGEDYEKLARILEDRVRCM
ncbi:AMP-binding protein [uncultured Paludibaculum sp.]|uniref:AMP-binding protein n=1 Tax=uncultured Paludibaculum sp. TaxID=1765020 RepID=UPI002AAB796C|nr:AMP-binding protein [uncultured Paludibaculum sp.]